jgi:hypothetical protein
VDTEADAKVRELSEKLERLERQLADARQDDRPAEAGGHAASGDDQRPAGKDSDGPGWTAGAGDKEGTPPPAGPVMGRAPTSASDYTTRPRAPKAPDSVVRGCTMTIARSSTC